MCCCNCWALTLRTVCLNTEWAIGIWHSWLKHLNCWWKVVWHVIRAYSMCKVLHVHLKSLNCSIWVTILVTSIKFAGYLVWLLTYKVWKFGSNLYYHGWNTAYFLGDCFFIGEPCICTCATITYHSLWSQGTANQISNSNGTDKWWLYTDKTSSILIYKHQ